MHKKTQFAAIGVVGALFALAGCTSPPAAAPSEGANGDLVCEPMSLAGLDDDSHRAAFWALENDLVTSDAIPSITVSYLQIPALIQATGASEYDVIMTSLPGVVLANERGGLDLRIAALSLAHSGGGLSLYGKKDSGIETAADLAGKTVATPSFGSTGTQEAQMVLAEKYGLDFALEGGDITWVELDPPTILNALEKGDIDAGLLWHQAGWLADRNPEMKKIAQLDVEFKEIANGAWPIGAAFVVQGEYVDANLECVNEFQDMLEESVEYAKNNVTEFSQELAAQTGVPAEFIEFWWEPENYMFGGVVNDEWVGYAREFYELAAEYGSIPVNPDLDKLIIPRG